MDTPKTIPYAGLCAGYDGIALGLKLAGLALRTVFNAEVEAFPVVLMAKKAENGDVGAFPCWTDVKTLPFHIFRKALRGGILSAGFPCQPFSHAGAGLATEDPRHLYPYIAAGISACRPRYVFLENVMGIISAKCKNQPGAEDGTPVLLYVLRDLESRGYICTWDIFSASEVGAPHQRKRVFILGELDAKRSGARRCLGHTNGNLPPRQHEGRKGPVLPGEIGIDAMADSVEHSRNPRPERTRREAGPNIEGSGTGAGVEDPARVGRGTRRAESGGLERRVGIDGAGASTKLGHATGDDERRTSIPGSDGQRQSIGRSSCDVGPHKSETGGIENTSKLADSDGHGCGGILRKTGCGQSGAQQRQNPERQDSGDGRSGPACGEELAKSESDSGRSFEGRDGASQGRGVPSECGKELGHTNGSGPQGRECGELPECAGEGVAGETGPRLDGHLDRAACSDSPNVERTKDNQSSRQDEIQSSRETEGVLQDRHRLSDNGKDGIWGMDSSGFMGWPARPGQAQYDWEPPRVTGFNRGFCRSADGSSEELDARQLASENVDRLRALGNGVVPATAARAWCVLSEKLEKMKHENKTTN